MPKTKEQRAAQARKAALVRWGMVKVPGGPVFIEEKTAVAEVVPEMPSDEIGGDCGAGLGLGLKDDAWLNTPPISCLRCMHKHPPKYDCGCVCHKPAS